MNVCGIDLHKPFLVASILGGRDRPEKRRFPNNLEGLLRLRRRLKEKPCREVAVESTGAQWMPLYTMLEEEFRVVSARSKGGIHHPRPHRTTLKL